MFYAVERSAKSNRVLRFSDKKLRTVWVRNDVNNRDYLLHNFPLITKFFIEDGDTEAWQIMAIQRINNSPRLKPYKDVLYCDWFELEHFRFIALGKISAIVNLARDVENNHLINEGEITKEDKIHAIDLLKYQDR